MGKQETKTLLSASGSSTTGEAVSTTISWGTVTVIAWLTKEEGAEFGESGVTVQGSVDDSVWLDLATFTLDGTETCDSLVITDCYRYYRAVTGTVAEDNYISVVAHCKGVEK